MTYAKRMSLCCIVFAALTVLVLRTSVAEAASLRSSVVGSATSAVAEMNISLNGGVAMPPGVNRGLFMPNSRNTPDGADSPNTALPNEALYGVAKISSKDVWAVGYSLLNSNSPDQTLTEHWNGTAWHVVASPNVGTSTNLFADVAAISSNDVWAVGSSHASSNSFAQTLAEHWNGTSWSVVKTPDVGTGSNFFYGVTAIASNDVWAVGSSYINQSSNSPQQTLAEHWNGTSWSVVASPNAKGASDFLNRPVAISSNDVWAVGSSYKTSKSPYQTLTEHWNGTSWSVVASPNPAASGSNYFYWVAAIASNNVWAVGNSLNNSTSPYQTLAEHWNGTSWSVVPSPNVGAYSNYLNAVVVISSNDAWATGGYYTSNSSNAAEQTLTEHWNGTSWSVVPSPNFGGVNTVNVLWDVVAISTSDVWTVGDNVTSSTNFQAFTEHWNGKSWSIIPPG